jgi:thiosulfate/3-mercaptopyruvate sulfurtransferase
MNPLTWMILVAAVVVAYANGANANFKGVASLYGSGTSGYAGAVRWAAVATAAGSLAAGGWGGAMVKAFSGRGLVPDAMAAEPRFLLAVAGGAGGAGLLATRLGFPVSTTHLLVGGLVGSGWVAGSVNGGKLWESFLRPLLVSPVLAVVAGVIVHAVVRRVSREREGRTRGLEAGHWLSAGAVCFARGLNDTPKMAALMAGSGWLGGSWAMVLVAAAMACGGVMGARRVAETLAHGITGMNPGEGFAANLATALLVTTASVHGLPVSTTHVSVGALLGIGLVSVTEAKEMIENPDASKRPVVLDTRGGYKDYFRGHLPTAHHINFDTLRGTDAAVPVQYLPEELTKALLVRAGVDRERTHLVYATGAALPNDEVLSTSMVVYVLEKAGVKDIRVVDGGLAEWVKAGMKPVQEYFGNPAGKLPKKGEPGIAADIKAVQAHAGKAGKLLIDARPLNEYQGEDEIWLRKGHIPGAISFHWARMMEKDNTHKFRPLEAVKAELAAAEITPDKDVICYCGTSREGSLLYFALRHLLGFPKVRLYEGAWKEYVWLEGQTLKAETGGKAAGQP